MNQTQQTSIYAFADACSVFDQRHPEWHEVFVRIWKTINLAFSRRMSTSADIEKFVYFQGNLVAEDFMELFLLAANGYGYGAMKLLRSMYEHTVVLKYLHDHPEELDAFFDYDRVQQHKLMQPIFDTFGEDALPRSTVEETKQRYEEVKDRFMVKTCNVEGCTCTHTRINHTWSKLDFVAMAKKTGDIGKLIVPAYFDPLRHAHSTYRAVRERLEEVDGHIGFSRESPPEEADKALMAAQNCLLVALQVQKERFNIPGLEEAFQTGIQDWARIWAPESRDGTEGDADRKS